MKSKESEDEQVNYMRFFFKQWILITENNKQKICGTLSLKDSLQIFFLKKKKL